MTITPDDLVRREVGACVSTLVSTLAMGGSVTDSAALDALTNQAMEICAPIDDWEEAAIQAGWSNKGYAPTGPRANWCHDTPETGWHDFESAQAACEEFGLDPCQREIFEHWIVSEWLARELESKGERIDLDFAGLCVWGRTCRGQAISIDSVIVEICAELNGAQP